jgi:hypothetical protein
MTARVLPPKANGRLPLRFGWWGLWHEVEVAGGPYSHRAKDHFGVCLLEREPDDYHVWLPIPDFSIPDSQTDVKWALTEVLYQLLRGRKVWIGCAGGFGRTGLMLALLAKVAGYGDPVGHVRKAYNAHAVETSQQVRYVEEFPVGAIRRWLLKKSLERYGSLVWGFLTRRRARA